MKEHPTSFFLLNIGQWYGKYIPMSTSVVTCHLYDLYYKILEYIFFKNCNLGPSPPGFSLTGILLKEVWARDRGCNSGNETGVPVSLLGH